MKTQTIITDRSELTKYLIRYYSGRNLMLHIIKSDTSIDCSSSDFQYVAKHFTYDVFVLEKLKRKMYFREYSVRKKIRIDKILFEEIRLTIPFRDKHSSDIIPLENFIASASKHGNKITSTHH